MLKGTATDPPLSHTAMEPSSTVTTQNSGGGVAPALYISVGIICAVLTSAFIVLAITLYLCWKRKKTSMNTGDNVAYGVNQTVVDISGNVAYGMNQNVVDTSENVAYVASTSEDKDKAAEANYDYVVTTEGNDIITTSQNEAYGTVPY